MPAELAVRVQVMASCLRKIHSHAAVIPSITIQTPIRAIVCPPCSSLVSADGLASDGSILTVVFSLLGPQTDHPVRGMSIGGSPDKKLRCGVLPPIG